MRGEKPERWVRQTSFDNDEAVGYLADRLARLGVEKKLAQLGAVPGAAVTIGEVTFDFEPTSAASMTSPTRRCGAGPTTASTRPPAPTPTTGSRRRRPGGCTREYEGEDW